MEQSSFASIAFDHKKEKTKGKSVFVEADRVMHLESLYAAILKVLRNASSNSVPDQRFLSVKLEEL